MLTDALSQKKDVAQEMDAPDNRAVTTASIAENVASNMVSNVVSIEAFQSKKLTVPKMSSDVPTFSNAIK